MVFIDRVIRMAVAIAIAVLYFLKVIQDPIGSWLLIVAVIFLVTSFTGFCPLYRLFGVGRIKAN